MSEAILFEKEDVEMCVRALISSIEKLKGSKITKKRLAELVRRVAECQFRTHDKENYLWDLFSVAIPYSVYLQTKVWQKKRKIVLENDCHRCRLCNSNKHLEVHHRTYESIGIEKFTDLITLCHECHSVFHKHRQADGQTGSHDIDVLTPEEVAEEAAELEQMLIAAKKKHETAALEQKLNAGRKKHGVTS